MILLYLIIRASLKSLYANKLRSLLAMLGIVIGVWAVITMLAVGKGAQNKVLDNIRSMGTNLLIVTPGQLQGAGVRAGTRQNLKIEDAEAMRAVPGVELITPAVGGSVQAKYLSQNTPTTATGIAITYLQIRDYEIGQGRGFTEAEAEGLARLAIIGPTTAENLFGTDDGIGQTIKINGINFKVIGITKAKGDQGWNNPDDQIFVPYTTAMRILFGQRYLREIDVQAKDGVDLDDVQANLTVMLRRRHHQHDSDQNDFYIRNQAQMIQQASSITQIFTILLGSVAGISLLVGGIGIMNIMLVSVTERTREIGVRKAIGARNRDILRQFLIEAVLISGLSGGLGVIGAIGTAAIIAAKSPITPTITPFSVFLAACFSGAVGVFFGFYPAWRAAALDPIEALRYE